MSHYKNVLFIGAGGGNDVFSTIFAANSLKEIGYTWDEASIAGVLSPFHQYEGVVNMYPSLYKITPSSKRFIETNNSRREISCVESCISSIISDEEFQKHSIKSVFGFDLDFGTEFLRDAIEYIADEGLVVLVDIGGDILYSNDEKNEVLSPMFDAMILSAVRKIPNSLVFLAGVGLDGEISVRNISKKIDDLDSVILKKGIVSYNLILQDLFNEKIKPIRSGNTVPRMFQVLKTKEQGLKDANNIQERQLLHNVRYMVGHNKYYCVKKHLIYSNMPKMVSPESFFVIKSKDVSNDLVMDFEKTFDWIMKSGACESKINFEAQGQFLRIKNMGLVLFLTPSHFFEDDKDVYHTSKEFSKGLIIKPRMKIFEDSLNFLRNGDVDSVLIYKVDAPYVGRCDPKGEFEIVSLDEYDHEDKIFSVIRMKKD